MDDEGVVPGVDKELTQPREDVSCQPRTVIDHFEKLENILTELDSFIQPRRIYDLDEKGCRRTLHHQQSVISVK